ncbi:acylphosphatase [Halopseudomonas salina]|uniref:Acylphosphatase n=1 Tax=Halopseudomonas salina TaxID=1323744 RepID=A0ABQ1NW21_9GAMM|nr:acylphosphatase [Halopseudomonas salina]GGC86270.1 acylphosphatase [Halopseudomonas salina]
MTRLSVQGFVRGKVQGVGFRHATVQQANHLGVDGWVRNRDDGSVEVMLCGEQRNVEALAQWLREGPCAARVDSVDLDACIWQDIAGFVQL